MPHDMNGNELVVGSGVLVPCKVKAIHLTEDYCNVDLETNIAMHPTNDRMRLTLNSRQTVATTSSKQIELLRGAFVIIDHVCKNGSAVGLADGVVQLAHELRSKIDKALA